MNVSVAAAELSLWEPLDASKSETRLLRLEPGGMGTDLVGSFVIRSLKYHPRYDAISHAWGPAGPSEVIHIAGIAVTIPLNLALCLRCFRKKEVIGLFWVDALW
jgi:hypothetical protein